MYVSIDRRTIRQACDMLRTAQRVTIASHVGKVVILGEGEHSGTIVRLTVPEAQVGVTGQVTLPTSALRSALRGTGKATDPVTIESRSDEVRLANGRVVHVVRPEKPREYAGAPRDGLPCISLRAGAFREAIESALAAAIRGKHTWRSRAPWNYISIERREDDGPYCYVAGTNGRRLVRHRLDCAGDAVGLRTMTLAETAFMLQQACRHAPADAEVRVYRAQNPSAVMLDIDGRVSLYSDAVEGTYYDYRRIVAKRPGPHRVVVDRRAMCEVFAGLASAGDEPTTWSIEPGCDAVSIRRSDASASIPIVGDRPREAQQFLFRPGLVLPWLRTQTWPHARVSWDPRENVPVWIEPEDGSDEINPILFVFMRDSSREA